MSPLSSLVVTLAVVIILGVTLKSHMNTGNFIQHRPLLVLVVGMLIIAICDCTPSCYAVPIAVLIGLTYVLSVQNGVPNAYDVLVNDTTARDVSFDRVSVHHGERSPDSIVKDFEEGFATASKRVDQHLREQDRATNVLQQTMNGAKLNADAIAKTMQKFQDIYIQKDAHKEKMANVRKGIRAIQETYVNIDGSK